MADWKRILLSIEIAAAGSAGGNTPVTIFREREKAHRERAGDHV
ncbi:hypothetical protein SZ54_1960 [Rhizobium sp. UR51a]|nr:hypothetical protein SZ54_1960 [Rhizobium sp. UR51a]